jgi:TRAP-type C4-dicarboxylate transport system permease small subunit
VLEIVGFVFLLFCGAWVAILGFAFSLDAPHAWKGEVRDGLIFGLIALALIICAILLLRRSIRRLRSLRQVQMADRNPRSNAHAPPARSAA